MENYLSILDYRTSDALDNFDNEKEMIKLEIKQHLLDAMHDKTQPIIYHRVHF